MQYEASSLYLHYRSGIDGKGEGKCLLELGLESRTPDTGAGERTKRLTIDVPVSLHVRIKAQCALRGTKMADEIRALLEERFPSGGPGSG